MNYKWPKSYKSIEYNLCTTRLKRDVIPADGGPWSSMGGKESYAVKYKFNSLKSI